MLASGELTSFLGWCAVINISFLLIATLMITLMRDTITGIHARLFGLSVDDVSRAYFQYLAQYKIATLVFTVVPYIALKIIA